MSAWIEFLKCQYRLNKITDAQLDTVNELNSLKGNKKITDTEKNDIKNSKRVK